MQWRSLSINRFTGPAFKALHRGKLRRWWPVWRALYRVCHRSRPRAWLGLFANDELHAQKIPKFEHQADAPQDRLQLFFSTHDVTLTGWQLRDFLRLLRDGKVAAVQTGAARYADLRRDAPYVTEIKIATVKE